MEKAREQHVEKQRQVRKQVKSRDCVRAQEEGGKCVVKVGTHHEGLCVASEQYICYPECDEKPQKILGPRNDKISSSGGYVEMGLEKECLEAGK